MKSEIMIQLTSLIQRNSMVVTLGNRPEIRKLPDRVSSLSESEIKEVLKEAYKNEVTRRGVRYSDISDTEIEEKIEKVSHWLYTEDPIRGLFLYGTVGSGKTTLMKAVCSLIRASGSGPDLAVLTTATALFLDDLGIEPSRCLIYGVERYPIQDIIYARYDRQLVTVITSNLDRSGLRDRYGERMYDRMAEMMLPLCFMATSYRRQTKK